MDGFHREGTTSSSGSSGNESACDIHDWASWEHLLYEWALHLRFLFRWLSGPRQKGPGRLGRREMVGEEER